MKTEEVQQVAREGFYNGRRMEGQLIETHISWIILTGKWVFKLKKPLKLSFLDYSTLASRAHYCMEEVRLNSRFSAIYDRCCPITHLDGQWYMDGKRGTVQEYAVVMKRLPEARRMDKLLAEGKVTDLQVKKLAEKVALFHRRQPAERIPFDLGEAKALFADVLNPSIRYTTEHRKFLQAAVRWSDAFLEAHQQRLAERAELGWVRDLHGDLHAGNVFLTEHPVIFDCIEFSKRMRTIDLLYEVAFLCMDLERFGQDRLADLFLESYLARIPILDPHRDAPLFTYFKCLRANVRAKVLGLNPSPKSRREQAGYLALMESYLRQEETK
ncbi:phosphotransferase [Cyclobacterium xiamenense]|uniref:phosphotransferase n=1 Tax=Cyclobacterium xiamenense TaxID=1297121 RepID=UPI0035D0A91F